MKLLSRVALAAFICWTLIFVSAAAEDEVDRNVWGTYRPNLYFGLRTKTAPGAIMMGTMWHGPGKAEEIRHDCNMNNQNVRYDWIRNDGRHFGQQEIHDKNHNIQMTTTFIGSPETDNYWIARLSGTSSAKGYSSIYVYFSIENGGSFVNPKRFSKSGLTSPFRFTGNSDDLGDFDVDIEFPSASQNELDELDAKIMEIIEDGFTEPGKVSYLGMKLPSPKGTQSWEAASILKSSITNEMQRRFMQLDRNVHSETRERRLRLRNQLFSVPTTLANRFDHHSTFTVFEFLVKGKFQIDIRFGNKSSNAAFPSFKEISSLISENEVKFDNKFEQVFNLEKKGFSESHVRFGRAALSNLLGGIGFFHGDYVVQEGTDVFFTEPTSLLTGVPSRSFFPRGFLWDEGFHQMIMQEWDANLSREIISSWMNLVTESGWLPREQILGPEARSKVPREFQAQKDTVANPPTLQVAIHKLITSISGNNIDDNSSLGNPEGYVRVDNQKNNVFLGGIFNSLKKHFDWFMSTQKGALENSFRWRGRTVNHTFASGLDDYPRGQYPHDMERHLDLHAWLTYYAKLMADISKSTGHDHTKYEKTYRQLLGSLDKYHWDSEQQLYADYVFDGKSGHFSKHTGYITLFPFLLGLIPRDSPKLKATLQIMNDPKILWSPYGLRSLSVGDSFYGQDEDYWRGAIWLNINYLALSSLSNDYAKHEGPYQKEAKLLYQKLRDVLIQNIFKEYTNTGFFWEQYCPKTGKGRRTHPFNGWTSLVLLIMAEEY